MSLGISREERELILLKRARRKYRNARSRYRYAKRHPEQSHDQY